MTLGNRIEYVMKSAHYTQSGLANRLKVNPSSVSTWISGRTNPTPQTLQQISDVLGCNYDYLASEIGDPFPPRSHAEEIGAIAKAASYNDPEEAADFFKQLLGGMTDSEILLLYEIFRRHFPQTKKED